MTSPKLLTTELIGVNVSWPLATVHGRPADCQFELVKVGIIILGNDNEGQTVIIEEQR